MENVEKGMYNDSDEKDEKFDKNVKDKFDKLGNDMQDGKYKPQKNYNREDKLNNIKEINKIISDKNKDK